MGQSTPTTTIALDTFVARYAAFRSELEPREQAWFDELVCRARRHSSAINRRPVLDFERPVILAMLLEGMRLMEDQSQDMQALRNDLREALDDIRDAGVAVRRVPAPPPFELGRVGQTRIDDHQAVGAIPA
ncbi:MAG: hypothetical protein ACYDBQ_08380 [Thermoplasmatota archaeon]